MCVVDRHVICAACVLLTGLFHRGISQSGTALCTWALAANGSSAYQAKKLASLLNCPTNPNADLVDCLRTKDAPDIIATDKQFMVGLYDVLGIKEIAYTLNTSCFVF
jgi:carboxylesterase type B